MKTLGSRLADQLELKERRRTVALEYHSTRVGVTRGRLGRIIALLSATAIFVLAIVVVVLFAFIFTRIGRFGRVLLV